MILVNTDFVTGKNLETIGIVNGGYLAGLRFDLDKIIDKVNANIEEKAKEMRADAVINIRYSFVGDGRCVLATGTAVKFV